MEILEFKTIIDSSKRIELEDILNNFADKLGTDKWEVYIEKATEEEINEFN